MNHSANCGVNIQSRMRRRSPSRRSRCWFAERYSSITVFCSAASHLPVRSVLLPAAEVAPAHPTAAPARSAGSRDKETSVARRLTSGSVGASACGRGCPRQPAPHSRPGALCAGSWGKVTFVARWIINLTMNTVSLAAVPGKLFLNKVALRALYTGALRRGGCGQPRYRRKMNLIQ